MLFFQQSFAPAGHRNMASYLQKRFAIAKPMPRVLPVITTFFIVSPPLLFRAAICIQAQG